MKECPLCKNTKSTLLYSGHVVLFRCNRCKAVVNEKYQEIEYNKDYFTKEYQSQYGKTYIEDFIKIYNLSQKRIQRIKSLKPIKGSLLDIGCAYGFFLKAAMDEGFTDLCGIEIAEEAADFCEKNYGIPVIKKRFENANITKKFSIITAWYFIEHLANPLEAFIKISDLLKKGGIFAFSVPSTFGPQFFFHKKEWFKNHPIDHRINFTPHCVRLTLRSLKFSKIITYPGGIHPERLFPPLLANISPLKWIYRSFSIALSFSDTLEIYAIK